MHDEQFLRHSNDVDVCCLPPARGLTMLAWMVDTTPSTGGSVRCFG